MILPKNLDNFDSIVNSLRPIKYKFSNKSFQIDNYFKFLNIESLEKRLHHKIKSKQTFHDSLLHKHIENLYNLNKDYIDYFEDKDGIKKMPLKIEKKENNFMNNLYASDFKNNIDIIFSDSDIKIEKKKINYIFRNKFNKKKEKPFFGSDPGYYHPNYKSIFKRSPSFEFGKLINTQVSLKKKKEDKEQKIDDSTIKEKNEEDNKVDNKQPEVKNNKTIFENYQENNEIFNNKIIKQNIVKNKNILGLHSKNNENSNKSAVSIFPKIILNNRKILKEKILIQKINSKRYQRKKYISPKTISFKRMKGRDTKNYNSTKKISGFIDYKPNYESTIPHVPSFSFRNTNIKKDYKKYKVGKIIRSYYYEPYKYFVMDFNKSKNKNKNHKNNDIMENYKKLTSKQYINN